MVSKRADYKARFVKVALVQLDRVEADVGVDAIEPGSERNRAPEGLPTLPCPSERFLDGVLGLVDRAQHPVAVDEQLAPIVAGLVSGWLGRFKGPSAIHCAHDRLDVLGSHGTTRTGILLL